jgi:site-specific DNA-methyltransferase (adenine-specific)
MTGSQPFTTDLIMSNRAWFKCEWIWEKNNGSNFANTDYMPMKEHENIIVFCKSTSSYNPIFLKRSGDGLERARYKDRPTQTKKREFIGGLEDTKTRQRTLEYRVPRSIIKFNTERGFHPTQKPVALFEYLIRTYTNPGETILDPFAGSGTTALAAHATGRQFICMERDRKYCEIANKRLALAQMQGRFEEMVG